MRLAIPSVGYGDMLEVVLPAWLSYLPGQSITVVSSLDDERSALVAEQAGVRLVRTDVWTRGGAVLNKGAALNEAFGFTGGGLAPTVGEVCIATDADVVPFGQLNTLRVQPGTLYGAPRYHCPDPQTLERHRAGRAPIEKLGLLARSSDSGPVFSHTEARRREFGARCLGFLQLFAYELGRAFPEALTAGGYDGAFARRFARKECLTGFYMLHLGGRAKANWRGRVLPEWGR